jgi:hypothetical protein
MTTFLAVDLHFEWADNTAIYSASLKVFVKVKIIVARISMYLDYTRHVMQNYLKICAVIWSDTLFVLVTLTVFNVSYYKITQIFI